MLPRMLDAMWRADEARLAVGSLLMRTPLARLMMGGMDRAVSAIDLPDYGPTVSLPGETR